MIGIKDFGFENLGGIKDRFRCHRDSFQLRELLFVEKEKSERTELNCFVSLNFLERSGEP